MEHYMRRKNQELPPDETIAILKKATSGVLSLCGKDGFPYAVPMSFAYQDGKIYFHCASQGHKLALIEENDRFSFCVIDRDEIVPEQFTTYFRSAILFGKARKVTEEKEKLSALHLLADKYSPGIPGREEEIQSAFHRVTVIALEIERMTGKEARELMEMRKR